MFDTVAKRFKTDGSVVGEEVGEFWIKPAVIFQLQGKGQVPVVKGDPRCDMMRQQSIDQFGIKAQSIRIGLASASGLNARPCNGGAISLHPHFGHQLDVLFKAMVMVASDISGVIIFYFSRNMAKRVPNGESLVAFE